MYSFYLLPQLDFLQLKIGNFLSAYLKLIKNANSTKFLQYSAYSHTFKAQKHLLYKNI